MQIAFQLRDKAEELFLTEYTLFSTQIICRYNTEPSPTYGCFELISKILSDGGALVGPEHGKIESIAGDVASDCDERLRHNLHVDLCE